MALLGFILSYKTGLCYIIAAGLLLPPVRRFVFLKTNKTLPVGQRAFLLISLIFVSHFFSAKEAMERFEMNKQEEAQMKSEKEARVRQESIEHFSLNREQIISAAKKSLLEEDYQDVISKTNIYLNSNDEELTQINTQAKNKLKEIQEAERTKQIIDELKITSKDEHEKNRSLYRQLLNMHPNNESYKIKFSHYDKKINEEKRKQVAAEERKKKIEAQFSKWNGAHSNLQRLVKKSMNDPNSYSHIETVFGDQGDYLIVQTTFRGKNAFGGVVKNTVRAKVSIDGDILEILD